MNQLDLDIESSTSLIHGLEPSLYLNYATTVFGERGPVFMCTNESFTSFLPPRGKIQGQKALCITGAGEIPIELSYRGAAQVDCFDINRLTKYLMKLKIAAILALNYNEYMDYFSDLDARVFNDTLYMKKIRKLLDNDTRFFWDNLYYQAEQIARNSRSTSLKNVGAIIANSNLFVFKILGDYEVISRLDTFLYPQNYRKTQASLETTEFNYFTASIFEIQEYLVDGGYRYIYLSNVAEYLWDHHYDEAGTSFRELITERFGGLLDNEGEILAAYIFSKMRMRSSQMHGHSDVMKEIDFNGLGGGPKERALIYNQNRCAAGTARVRS